MRKNNTSFLWILIGLVLIILIVFVVSVQENGPKQNIAKHAGSGREFNTAENDQTDAQHPAASSVSRSSLAYPPEYASSITGGQLIEHTGFALMYIEEHEQAAWVAYELTRDELEGSVGRSDKFVPDEKVRTGSAENDDYRNSGFDRGHLAPAADMKWSKASMDASFYFSNMSPQRPGFNRGIWKEAEEQLREWAKQHGALYVVTGPVLRHGLPAIGNNQVSIPEYYYKVAVDTALRWSAALLIPHRSTKLPPDSFRVSIDSIENLTGIDFYYQLPIEELED
jgi:endonuclease G